LTAAFGDLDATSTEMAMLATLSEMAAFGAKQTLG